jgi:fumarate reductase flavoprotein subunit
MHCSLVIVGAGACGLVAALWAKRHGVAQVVVLERESHCSGSTALSSGFIPAAGTKVQASLGIVDSPERFAQDIQAKAHALASTELVAAYSQAIAPTLDLLTAEHGLQFEVLQGFLYPGHSVERMHAVRERTGAALLAQLERAAVNAGVDVLFNAQVVELEASAVNRKCVSNLHYRIGVSDDRETVSFDGLILACNGYGGNAQLVAQYLPTMRDAWYFGHTGNQGDAVKWGLALGANLADMSGYQGHGSVASPHGVLISWALLSKGAVMLNAQGNTFFGQDEGYSEAAEKVCAQPGGVAYSIFDATCHQFAQQFPDFVSAESAGAVRLFTTALALAQWIGDEQLESRLSQLGPFPRYAIRVTGALFHTQGGLDVDANCRVKTFDNLWAAGGAARGVSGPDPSGYLSGNGLLSAVAGGALAGRDAARQLIP